MNGLIVPATVLIDERGCIDSWVHHHNSSYHRCTALAEFYRSMGDARLAAVALNLELAISGSSAAVPTGRGVATARGC